MFWMTEKAIRQCQYLQLRAWCGRYQFRYIFNVNVPGSVTNYMLVWYQIRQSQFPQKWKTMIVIGHIGYRKYKYWETLGDMMCLETIFRTHIVVHGLLYIVFGFSEIFLIAMFEMLCKLIKANNTSFCHHACRALSIHIGLWSIRGTVYRLVVPLAELTLANRAENF